MCEICGADTYTAGPELPDYDGEEVCEGCDMPTDSCTCDDEDDADQPEEEE